MIKAIHKINNAASPVISIVLAMMIVTSTIGTILIVSGPMMEEESTKGAREEVAAQFEAMLDSLEDLSLSGDTTKIPISADKGTIKDEGSKRTNLGKEPEEIPEEDDVPEVRGDRSIIAYSLDDEHNFTVSGLDDNNINFKVKMEDGGLTKVKIFWLDDKVKGPILYYWPESYNFSGIYINDIAFTEFEIWNGGIDTLLYELEYDEKLKGLEVSPMAGSSMGEHDSINISINTTGLEVNKWYYYELNITSNGGLSSDDEWEDNKGNFTMNFSVYPTDNPNPPVGVDDYITIEAGETVTKLDDDSLSVLANDYDIDPGDDIYIDFNEGVPNVNGPSCGSLTLNKDGTFEYIHDEDNPSSYDEFIYTLRDKGFNKDTAVVHIRINSPAKIVDYTKPPAYTGDYFIFNASVTDDDLDVVKVEYWIGSWCRGTKTMSYTGFGDFYEGLVEIPDNSTEVLNYNISAIDELGFKSFTGDKDVGNIIDNDPPEFIDSSKDLFIENKVVIWCKAFDNVSFAYANVTLDGAEDYMWFNESSSSWEYNVTDVAEHDYWITIFDTAGYSAQTDCFDIYINSAPNSSDGEITMDEDTTFTFSLNNFSFSDDDTDDELKKVIVTDLDEKAKNNLLVDGKPVEPGSEITRNEIITNKLTFTPFFNENGIPYAEFLFKVSDGKSESQEEYTMTINVKPLNDCPKVKMPSEADPNPLIIYPNGKGKEYDGEFEEKGEGGTTRWNFNPIPIDYFMDDRDIPPDSATWTYSGDKNLLVQIIGSWPDRQLLVSVLQKTQFKDQSNEKPTGLGYNTDKYIAQEFTVGGKEGVLEKVNLSLRYDNGPNSPLTDITVKIYENIEDVVFEGGKECSEKGKKSPLAETTIDAFPEKIFSWKEAVFDTPPKLNAGKRYYIVIPPTENGHIYTWEYTNGNNYDGGMIFYQNVDRWEPIEDEDFLFKTYMKELPWADTETITFTATDEQGCSDSDIMNFTVIAPPIIDNIPDQYIEISYPSFPYYEEIYLDDYVSDYNNSDDELIWTHDNGHEYTSPIDVTIDELTRVANITVWDTSYAWNYVLTFTVEDPDLNKDSESVVFSFDDPSYPPPELIPIDNQTIEKGESFQQITLDDYTTYEPKDDVMWVCVTPSNGHLTVDIDENRVATITIPGDYTGTETITFKARTEDSWYNETSATFTIRSFEIVTGEAYTWGSNKLEMYGYVAGHALPEKVEVWFEWYSYNALNPMITSGVSRKKIIDTTSEESMFYCIANVEKDVWAETPNFRYRVHADSLDSAYPSNEIVGTWKNFNTYSKLINTDPIDTFNPNPNTITTTSAELQACFHMRDWIIPLYSSGGDDYIDVYFNVWGTGVELFTPTIRTKCELNSMATYEITGLKPGCEYTYTAFVSHAKGCVMDLDGGASFTTDPPAGDYKPVVANVLAYDITGGSAKIKGNLGFLNSDKCTVGFFVKDDLNSAYVSYSCGEKTSAGQFELTLDDLDQGKTYYWRAWASNLEAGSSYAQHWDTFKTEVSFIYDPVVCTSEFQEKTFKYILNGNLVDDGNYNLYVGFEYWDSDANPFCTEVLLIRKNDQGDSSFSIPVQKSFLGIGERWYYRAVAGYYFEDMIFKGEVKDFIVNMEYNHPEADFTYSSDGLVVSFDASSNIDQDEYGDSITETYFNFGDGKVSTSLSDTVEHYYHNPGTYTVEIHTKDDENRIKIKQQDIVVSNCFLAGTKVLMADGSYTNIENVNIGDMVKSFDEEKSQVVSSKVTNLFHHPINEMLSDFYLIINDDLKVTPYHQIFSNGKWVSACELKVGDILFDSNQKMNCRIESIDKIFEKQPVFDLTIDIYHNYFVSINGVDILVHNNHIENNYNEPIPDGMFNMTIIDEETKLERNGDTYTITSDEKWPLIGTVCIYLYQSKDLIGKIWILDSDSLTYTIPSKEGTFEVSLSNGGIIYSDSKTVKRSPSFHAGAETLSLRVIQTVVLSNVSTGGGIGYDFIINGTLHASRIRETKKVYNLTMQMLGSRDEIWFEHYEKQYPELLTKKEYDDTEYLYFNPSSSGTRLALSLFTLNLQIS